MAEKFYTDGMTVQQILDLGDDVLRKMSARDMSRALRTVSLAANKRIMRLEKQAVKRKDGYEEKKSGKGISTAALNAVTNDGKMKAKFGVGNKKTKQEMYSEFARVRSFMGMRTSTVKGAVQVRKEMEKRAFGKTREEAAKKVKTKKQKAVVTRTFQDKVKETYSEFRKFLENHEDVIGHNGSDQILELIGKKIISEEKSGEEALQEAYKAYDYAYKKWQENYQQQVTENIDKGVNLGDLLDEYISDN